MAKILLLNGSPHRDGCTFTALQEMVAVFQAEDIETEIFQVGTKPVSGCIGCGSCRKQGRCFMDDSVNEFVEKVKMADGLVLGSPVHYAAISGALASFLDRVFYSGSSHFAFKPGAAVASARRAGTTAALDQLNKYFTISKMPVVSSQYWNMVHGQSAEEILHDKEGMQTVRVLARNMVWLLRCIEAGRKAGVELPEQEPREMTNFVR